MKIRFLGQTSAGVPGVDSEGVEGTARVVGVEGTTGVVGVAGAGETVGAAGVLAAPLGLATITTINFFSSILYLESGSSSTKSNQVDI